METKTVAQTMLAEGFIPSNVATQALGKAHVSVIIRAIERDELKGKKVGNRWFVSASSVLSSVKDTPMEKQVRQVLKELGVLVAVKKGKAA